MSFLRDKKIHIEPSFMELALEEARAANQRGEVPVGAILVVEGRIVARAGNAMREHCNPAAHAEMLVIAQAAQILKTERMTNADLYVTLEPCTMCAGAISLARIRRLYFGARDEKGGAIVSGVRFFNALTCHHKPEIYSGFAETECAAILKNFFALKRLQEKQPSSCHPCLIRHKGALFNKKAQEGPFSS